MSAMGWMAKVWTVGLLACGVALGMAVPAWAVQVSCGDIISQDTKVSNDLSNCPDHGLVIDTSNVTLNLNGHTVDGDGSNGHRGILIEGNLENVIVKGGKVRQFDDGVLVESGAVGTASWH